MSDQQNVKVLPILPLKNALLFPNLLMPLSVGRSSSLAAVQAALATEDKEIVLVAQRLCMLRGLGFVEARERRRRRRSAGQLRSPGLRVGAAGCRH